MNESKAKKLILPILAAALCLGIVAFFGVSLGTEEKPATITVSAAASLTEAFIDITSEFEAANPDTKVELNFAGSGTLRMQIEGGAPIDVFASASQAHMDLLSEENLIENSSRKNFAANTLVMVVPEKNGAETPKSLEDLTAEYVEKIAIGNPESAPVGKYTKQAMEDTGVWEELESKVILAENVKQVLTYVETGEVDAGFVYMTDAESGRKDMYEITYMVPVSESISYPIAVLSKSTNKEGAQEFVDFVTGTRGQEILTEYGFKAA
ncbi:MULTISPECIES: molybdate ABC transporter substrate-binding protein [unclassified Methanosarcina]|uniref:molybdate ABC transporter substrate-binding protein n=1 Tax=unclassified Methanosarcina TaxID=2644672 RepID=UPI0006160315|nr:MULTISPECIES: molybdate ABC transporter substrate-binding protein [unclassified Methanosarcina]AKB17673.1 Molybdenum ABC transporter, periplasmic molybdenum-binding protein ModA [Methanosarcina sp. WWM596]AKB21029.1 Molybdenum ABC transporter, periplasmic molybdenum-binding protein ModA [Methanosarcina sp. WH1]